MTVTLLLGAIGRNNDLNHSVLFLPLQSKAESGPRLAAQSSCPQKFPLECTSVMENTAAVHLCMGDTSLESSKNKNKKRRRGEIINIPAVFHYVTVRDKIAIGFLLRRWCLKEYLYSWLVFIFMNKFMSQTSWLASYSDITAEVKFWRGVARYHYKRWERNISLASLLNSHGNKIKTCYLLSGWKKKYLSVSYGIRYLLSRCCLSTQIPHKKKILSNFKMLFCLLGD